MVRKIANFYHQFLPLFLLLTLLPSTAQAQTAGPPPIELWPIGCIYFFCLFRYRFDQLLSDALQKFVPNNPAWLGRVAAWAVLIGLPLLSAYIVEVARPIMRGTAYFMRLQSGVPDPEDDAITYLTKAAVHLAVCAFLGLVIQQYVKYIGGGLTVLLFRLKPDLPQKHREAAKLFLAAAALSLIARTASVIYAVLLPQTGIYGSNAAVQPDILAKIAVLSGIVLLGLLVFRLPVFMYRLMRKNKPQQPIWFHGVVSIYMFSLPLLIVYLGVGTSLGFNFFIMLLNVPLLGFVTAILVEGFIKIFAEVRYMAIPSILRPLVLSVTTALLIVAFYFLAFWP